MDCHVTAFQILLRDIDAHQASVSSINDAGRDVITSEGGAAANKTRDKLDRLNADWEDLLTKTKVRDAPPPQILTFFRIRCRVVVCTVLTCSDTCFVTCVN